MRIMTWNVHGTFNLNPKFNLDGVCSVIRHWSPDVVALQEVDSRGRIDDFFVRLAKAVGDHRHVGDVRGEGMLAAVEFVEDRDDRKFFDTAKKVGPQIAAALAERRVIGRAMPQGDILGFAPPLCLTREEADIVVSKTADAVKSVFANL